MSIFSFSYAILLLGFDTSALMNNSIIFKVGPKDRVKVFTTIICLEFVFGFETGFWSFGEKLEGRLSIRFFLK